MPDKGIDFVFLQKEGHALHIGIDDLLLVTHHRFQIEFGLADGNPHRRKIMSGLFKQIGGVQQGF